MEGTAVLLVGAGMVSWGKAGLCLDSEVLLQAVICSNERENKTAIKYLIMIVIWVFILKLNKGGISCTKEREMFAWRQLNFAKGIRAKKIPVLKTGTNKLSP
jgi:hypothetical protein